VGLFGFGRKKTPSSSPPPPGGGMTVREALAAILGHVRQAIDPGVAIRLALACRPGFPPR
jgi:hypothetical protein